MKREEINSSQQKKLVLNFGKRSDPYLQYPLFFFGTIQFRFKKQTNLIFILSVGTCSKQAKKNQLFLPNNSSRRGENFCYFEQKGSPPSALT